MVKKMKVIITGMIVTIIFWLGSTIVAFDWKYDVTPMMIGSSATPEPMSGNENGRLNTTSGWERSRIHQKNGSWRSSIVWNSTW